MKKVLSSWAVQRMLAAAGSRPFPSPSASVDLAGFARVVAGGCACFRRPFSEPEVEGERCRSFQRSIFFASYGRRTKRSTIYSGSRASPPRHEIKFKGRPIHPNVVGHEGRRQGLARGRPKVAASTDSTRQNNSIHSFGFVHTILTHNLYYAAWSAEDKRYASPRCSIEIITHSSRRATATIAFLAPQRAFSRSYKEPQ